LKERFLVDLRQGAHLPPLDGNHSVASSRVDVGIGAFPLCVTPSGPSFPRFICAIRGAKVLGIEVYADRPRELWQWEGNAVKLATIELDLHGLARLAVPEWSGVPPGTRLGHMYLTVGNLERSPGVLRDVGTEYDVGWGTFKFLSCDGYHHPVALNLVEGRDAGPLAQDIAGLESFSIESPFTFGGSAGSLWNPAAAPQSPQS
jgi:hypothetical protein